MNNQTNTTQNITSEEVANVLNLDLANYIDTYNYINAYHRYDRDFKILEDNKAKQVGFELEVQCNDYNVDLNKMAFLTRQNFDCLTASDCSIGRGYEIITDVLGLDDLRNKKNAKTKAFFKYLQDNNFKSHDANGESCGLHIHVNRDKLIDGYDINDTDKHNKFIDIVCILELLFDNFKNELKTFSRRSYNHFGYCSFLSDLSDTKKDLFTIKNLKNDNYSSHSVAINLQHRNTLEFRIFRGTLELDTIIASIELCYNLIEIAKGIYNKTITNYKKITWNYIVNYNSDYSELIAYNDKRKIVSNVSYIDNTILEQAKRLKANQKTIKKSEKTKALLINIDAYLTTHARRILKLKNSISDLRALRDIVGVNYNAKKIKQYFDVETLKSDRYNIDTTLLINLRDKYDTLTNAYYNLISKVIDGKIYYYFSDDNMKYYTDVLKEIKKIEASEEYHALHYQVRDLLRGGIEL